MASTSYAAFGQSAAAAFAAVSIKAVKPDFAALKGAPQPAISVSPGSVTMRNVTLKDVIMAAYGMKDAGKPDGESGTDIAGGTMVFRSYSMAKLADYLSARSADHPVTDATGLGGPFDFTVQLADGESASPVDVKRALGQANRDGTLAALVAEQLGLKLESRKGPVPILVIDHAEKPSEN
jgi:hypothetical protein